MRWVFEFIILAVLILPWLGIFGPQWTYWALIVKLAGAS